MEIDFDRIADLFDVVQKQSTIAPSMTYIGQAAMAELKEINDELAQEAKDNAVVDSGHPQPTGKQPSGEDEEDIEQATTEEEANGNRRV